MLLNQELFKDDLGVMRKHKANPTVNENTKPVFHKDREIPFAIQDMIGKELDQI